MISIEQIKAARGLLDWTQQDLADATGLSKPAINNLERRSAKPRYSTLEAIEHAFAKAGVEFIKGGVRFQAEPLKIKVLEGSSALERLMNDVEEALGETGGLHLVSSVDERRFVEVVGEQFFSILEHHRSLGIFDRVLVRKGDDYFISLNEAYRWLPEEMFQQVPYMVYGDRYAILLWEPEIKIIIIENPQIAESYRQQFWVSWENAEIPAVEPGA